VAEKVVENVLSVTGCNLAYRPYFRAISELLLGPAVDPALAFDVIIPVLVKKAEVLAVRQYPNDAEYIYSVLKLLNRIGLTTVKGHTCVLRIKDMWKNVHNKFVNNRKFYPNPAAEIGACWGGAGGIASWGVGNPDGANNNQQSGQGGSATPEKRTMTENIAFGSTSQLN
jgi:hypothetical protein